MKIKKIIIVVLLLLIPLQMVGCSKATPEVENTTPAAIATELTDEQYIAILMDISMRNSDGFQQITALSEEIGNADWEAKMNIELEKIRTASLEYLGLQNIPEKYSKVHEHVTESMLYYILAVDAYPVKSADQSVESFNITSDYITKGTAHIIKATEELDKIK